VFENLPPHARLELLETGVVLLGMLPILSDAPRV
jgi:hypothetical protein